ncbi:hypothetical protein V6R21_28065 [Limibacter armeniacum]|uniref:hypothetical protein n=1 Tax=Limibacter armeniacum TaxID=466084 RepID=UPI002FE6B89A
MKKIAHVGQLVDLIKYSNSIAEVKSIELPTKFESKYKDGLKYMNDDTTNDNAIEGIPINWVDTGEIRIVFDVGE